MAVETGKIRGGRHRGVNVGGKKRVVWEMPTYRNNIQMCQTVRENIRY